VIRNLLLVCVIEFGCSKGVFKELADFILSEAGVCRDTILCRSVFVGDLWRYKKEHLVLASLRNGDFGKLCKIQLGISNCCYLRALSPSCRSGACFAASF